MVTAKTEISSPSLTSIQRRRRIQKFKCLLSSSLPSSLKMSPKMLIFFFFFSILYFVKWLFLHIVALVGTHFIADQSMQKSLRYLVSMLHSAIFHRRGTEMFTHFNPMHYDEALTRMNKLAKARKMRKPGTLSLKIHFRKIHLWKIHFWKIHFQKIHFRKIHYR